jgi:hypothetical protein
LPVPKDTFHACFSAWVSSSEDSNVLLREGQLAVLLVPFKAGVSYKDSIDDLKHAFLSIDDWINEQMQQAPQGINRGFFIGIDFWFLDIYEAMVKTAYDSASIALATSALVILLSS